MTAGQDNSGHNIGKNPRMHTEKNSGLQTYEVGYGRPPKHSQFKKGVSGNPKGRPRGAKNVRKPLKYELAPETLKATFLEEAYRLVNINTGHGEESIPIARAVIRALGVKAAKGHISAQRLFSQTLFHIEAEERRRSEEYMNNIVAYKQHWSQVLENRRVNKLPLDPPVPHPDHIHLDMGTGAVEIRGPLDEKERDEQDRFKELLNHWRDEAEHYREWLDRPYLENADDDLIEFEDSQREFAKGQLASSEKIISILEMLIWEEPAENVLEILKASRGEFLDG